MTKTLTPPANLDPTVCHTRAEYRQWQAEWATYAEALRGEQQREEAERRAADVEASRVLSDEEYDALALKRHADAQAKLAESAAEERATQDADAAYLASQPEIAEVSARSEHRFLLDLQSWFLKGYTVEDDSIQHFSAGCYAVRLHKPTSAKRSA